MNGPRYEHGGVVDRKRVAAIRKATQDQGIAVHDGKRCRLRPGFGPAWFPVPLVPMRSGDVTLEHIARLMASRCTSLV